MDSFEKFEKKTQLPTKEDFYSILNNEHIKDEEYDHAKNVSSTFDLKNMGEYYDIYLKSDVLLLADVFETFRKTNLQLSAILQIGSLSLFYIAGIVLGCYAEND